jgi:cell division protease FtsH
VHARRVKLSPQVDLAAIAARTAGFAGADLANLINEAALLAGRLGKDQIGTDDVDEAIERLVAGLKKRTRVMNRKEKETVAYHEAGHALVAEFRQYADRVAKVSIIPRGIAALGYTQQLPTEDRYLLKKAELLDRLDVFLGGRVAEETGAGRRLDRRRTTCSWRPTWRASCGQRRARRWAATFQAAPATAIYPLRQRNAISQQRTARDRCGNGALAQRGAYARQETLFAKRKLLDALAHALLAQETVDRATLDVLLTGNDDASRAAGESDSMWVSPRALIGCNPGRSRSASVPYPTGGRRSRGDDVAPFQRGSAFSSPSCG